MICRMQAQKCAIQYYLETEAASPKGVDRHGWDLELQRLEAMEAALAAVPKNGALSAG
jgi:hypothetical protein